MTPPLLYRAEDAAARVGVGRTRFYAYARRFRTLRDGRRCVGRKHFWTVASVESHVAREMSRGPVAR